MTRIHCFQHVPFETPARIAAWAGEHRHSLTVTRFHDHETPPPARDYDWLVVMGGPMSATDEKTHRWLTPELSAVEEAIAARKTVVGVCLGAQVIARVLGARVYPNPAREIGWYAVELTEAAERHPLTADLPESFTAFHWHSETFDVPAGAVHLARSEACAHQMFAWSSHVVGIQFHLEMTGEVIAALAEHSATELIDAPYVQPRDEILAENTHLQAGYDVLDSILSRL
jgi:GMP synthase-like glutamine amidotransferase